MVKLRSGGGPMNLEAVDQQRLRTDIESAAAGKTNLTDFQLVDLLLSASPRNRKLLSESVAICRGNDAVDEPTPVASKRRKKDESSGVELLSSSVSVTLPEKDGSSDPDGDGRKETDKNGDGGSTYLNGPTSRVSEGRHKSGDGRRELNSNGGGRWRTDVRASNRPMFRDFDGISEVLEEFKREAFALHQLKVLHLIGVEPTARILMHGPSGCGKTTLIRALANEAGVPFYEISALVSGVSDAQEEYIRELLSAAYMRAPSIVFIDDVDAMASKTASLQKEIEPRMVNLLMDCMDEQFRLVGPVNHEADSECSISRPGQVLLIVATNRPDAIDPGLRGRFDREIIIDAPSQYDRCRILTKLSRKFRVEFDVDDIAMCTLGFVGGDLVALAKMAGTRAVYRIMHTRMDDLNENQEVQIEKWYKRQFCDEEYEEFDITREDFAEAAMKIQPSSKIDRFLTVPNAKWDDVGGLQLLKLEFESHVVNPIKFPDVYKDPPVNLTTSFFLYGPSGCGKTLIVEALANEAGANLLHIKACDLVAYGGFSKVVVQIIFSYASTHPPCIVFFDELDAITPYNEDEGRWPDFRQLILELGNRVHELRNMSGVYVIGATNRREIVMNHLPLIQSKFDKTLYVPRPSSEERGMILKALARNMPIYADVDLMALGKDAACEKFNSADLAAVMKEAAAASMDRPRSFDGVRRLPWTIKDEHFKSALKKISPSVSPSV